MIVQVLFIVLLAQALAECPLNVQQMPSTMRCMHSFQCASDEGSSRMVYQTCSLKWYSVRNQTSTLYSSTGTTDVPYRSQQIQALSAIKKASKDVKMNSKFMVVNYGDTLLYYNFANLIPSYFSLNCTAIDYQILSLNDSLFEALAICSNQVVRILFSNSQKIDEHEISLNHSFSSLKCLQSESICLLGTKNGQLLYYNYQTQHIQLQYTLFQQLQITKITYKRHSSTTKVYISCINGMIYELVIKDGAFTIERQSRKFLNEAINELHVSPDGNYLIVSDYRANLTQLSSNSGILLDTINLEMYMTNKAEMSVKNVFINETTYIIFNAANQLLFAASVDPANVKNQYYLTCFNMNYYNSSLQECKPCSYNCSTCDPINGSCYSCVEGHFNKQGECLSCYFEEEGLSTYFKQCFSQSQKALMDSSSQIIKFLSFSLSNFSNFLNILGVFFIFMKVINNWNIISLYLFLPIPNLPFFLSNVLTTIYNNFNGSVFQYFKIELNLSFNVKNGLEQKKYQITNRSTDFLKQNGENLILFVYAVILILTVFKFVNFIFSKYNYEIFQHNHYFAILDQFIGTFTTSLLPFFCITQLKCQIFMDKVNACLFYNLTGIAIIAPFLILIVSKKKRKTSRTNKVSNLDDIVAIQLIENEKFNCKIRSISYDKDRQSFLYAILSFSIAILAPYENPLVFFIVISLIHILSIINIRYSKEKTVNNFIQKINSFLFHIGFILIYVMDNYQTQFYISLAIVFLILFGTIHEILIGIFRKIYLVVLIVEAKIEKNKKIQQFLDSGKTSKHQKNREHPRVIRIAKTSPEIQHQREIQQKKVLFDGKVREGNISAPCLKANKILPVEKLNVCKKKQQKSPFDFHFGLKTQKSMDNRLKFTRTKRNKDGLDVLDKR